eukprot:7936207-Pyramimonas_sp.AAC.1
MRSQGNVMQGRVTSAMENGLNVRVGIYRGPRAEQAALVMSREAEPARQNRLHLQAHAFPTASACR